MSWRLLAFVWLVFFFSYLFTGSSAGPRGDACVAAEDAAILLSGRHEDFPRLSKYSTMAVAMAIPVAWMLDHLPGTSSVGRVVLIHIVPASLGASGVVLFLGLLRMVHGRLKSELVVLIAFSLGTFYWHYSRIFYSEVVQVPFLLAGLVALLWHRQQPDERRAMLVGVLAGSLVLCKTLFVLFLPIFAVAVATAGRRRSRTVWDTFSFVAGLMPALVIYAWHNHLRYGEMFTIGYAAGRDGTLGFATPLMTGLYGLYFSVGVSVFLFAPPVIVGVLAYRGFLRTHRFIGVVMLTMIAVQSVAVAKWWSWSGGWCWGPRLILTTVPLWMVAGAGAFDRWYDSGRKPVAKFLTIAALAGCILLQCVGNLISPHRYPAYLSQGPVAANYPSYSKGVPTRDDALHRKFVPEFSMIPGNWALLKNRFFESHDLRRSYPWRSLNVSEWQPRRAKVNVGIDMWPLTGWLAKDEGIRHDARCWALYVAVAGTVLLLATGLLARRSVKLP